jgi:hypothetical protein
VIEDIARYEFNSMDEYEKGAALWEYGVHLTLRFDGDIGYSLYQLNNFYLEVMFNRDQNAIKKFTAFSTATKLGYYFEKIEISLVV